MHVLVITSEWPSFEHPYAGVFVLHQVQALRELGIEVNVLDFRGRKNILRYNTAFLRMRSLLRTERYDLIHAHFGQAGFLAILQRKVPVVVTFHGSDLLGLPGTNSLNKFWSHLLKLVSLFAARSANEVILVSQRLSSELPPRTYHIIPMGTDTSLFKPMPQGKAKGNLGWPLNEKSVLFIGNPTNPVKRYELALETVALSSQSIPNVKLRICHNEPQERVPDYMNASDVLIVTSLHESGPLVVREALACNLPVVSVDVGDVREYVGLVDGCAVCSDDRPGTLAAALKQVFKREMRIDGRTAVEHLDERVLAQKVIGIYKLALS